MKRFFAFGFGLFLSALVSAATFNLFSPATGILKGSASTYVTTAAASSDVISLFTSCSGVQYLGADGACHSVGGGGTVTSVALTVPSGFSVGGSPVTTSGTLAITGTLAVAAGGTGTTTSTGSGNVVLSASPTLTGITTAGTVAATAVTVGGNNVCQVTGTNCPSTARTAYGKLNGSGVCIISNTGGLTTPCTRNSTGSYTITHSPTLSTNTSCAITADSGSSTITQITYDDNGTTLDVFTFAGGTPTDASVGILCMSN